MLAVGAASYVWPQAFPDATVWSHFGQGYGYVPLVLPFLGLAYLLRHPTPSTASPTPARPSDAHWRWAEDPRDFREIAAWGRS